jgi:hypothetical protein
MADKVLEMFSENFCSIQMFVKESRKCTFNNTENVFHYKIIAASDSNLENSNSQFSGNG